MLSGSMKMKNMIIQGDGNVEDVTVGHCTIEDSVVMKMGSEVLMCMRNDNIGVKFPTDVGFEGNVVFNGNVESSDGASIQIGETIMTESDLKRLLALL